MQRLEPSDPSKSCIGSGRWDGAHAARRRSSVDDQSPEDKRSEERRVGKEGRWTGDWSSDVCSSDLYTMRFAEKVGQGAVVAFEPAGSCYEELVRRCSGWSQVTPVKAALGADDGMALMQPGDDPLSTTNRLRTRDRKSVV